MMGNIRNKHIKKVFYKGILLKILFLAVFMMFGVAGMAQKVPGMKEIDSITWALYNRADWSRLAEKGNEAIKNGIDYYYLRMRVGIAYYEMENYRAAIPHFKKALEFNPMDKVAVEYLYLCYLSGGRKYDAQKISNKLGKSARERLGLYRQPVVEEIYIEGGPSKVGDIKQEERPHRRPPPVADTIYNSGYYYNNIYYGHAGIKLRLSPSISIYQGYSYLEAPVTEKLTYMNERVPDFEYTTIQHEYYGNLEVNLPGSVLVTPSFHMLWIKYGLRVDQYNPETFSLDYDTVVERENMSVASLSLRKDVGAFAAEISGTYGNFGHTVQKQLTLAGYYYPLGNLDFYGKTGVTYLWNENDNRWIFHQLLGWSPAEKLWLEATADIGQLQDYAEKNAFVVYNVPEKINYKIEGVLLYEFSENLELSLRYRYMQRVNSYLYYTSYEDFTFKETKYPYHTIIGGIKWKF